MYYSFGVNMRTLFMIAVLLFLTSCMRFVTLVEPDASDGDADGDGDTDADSDGDGDGDTDADGDRGNSPDVEFHCSPGTADCNRDRNDRCETDLTSDPLHCGICDHDCLGGTCADSQCEAFRLAVPQGSPDRPWNGFLTVGPEYVYFGYNSHTSGGVSMAAKDGSFAGCVACDIGEPRELATDEVSVYWVDVVLGEVRRAPLGVGASFTTLHTGPVGTPIAVDGPHVYWVDTSLQAVMESDFDGNYTTQIASWQGEVVSIAAQGGSVFWAANSDVRESVPPSDAFNVLASGQPHVRGVAADAAHVYWVVGPWGGPNTIHRIHRGRGNTIETVATRGAYDLALTDTHVFVADGFNGEIWRVAKDGGTTETLTTGQPYPFDIAVDDVAVYWSSETDASVGMVVY